QQYCVYASREFGKGPLSCSVSIRSLFELSSTNLASQVIKDIDEIVKQSPSNGGTIYTTEGLSSTFDNNKIQKFVTEFTEVKSKIICSFSSSIITNQSLSLEIACSKRIKTPIYKLQ